jgi:hypothetical protein
VWCLRILQVIHDILGYFRIFQDTSGYFRILQDISGQGPKADFVKKVLDLRSLLHD